MDSIKKIIATVMALCIVLGASQVQEVKAQGTYTLKNYDKQFIDKWRDLAQELGEETGIPYQASMTQWLVESDRGRSYNARMRNNLTGQKVPGSTENQVFSSQGDSIRAYFKNVSKNSCYTNRGSLRHKNDPHGFLLCIAEVYCPGQGYYEQLAPILNAVIAYENSVKKQEEAAKAKHQSEIEAARLKEAERVLGVVEDQIYQQEYERLYSGASCLSGISLHIMAMVGARQRTVDVMEDMRYAVAAGSMDAEAVSASIAESDVVTTAAAGGEEQ